MPQVEIVIPQHLHKRLKTLAQLEQETNGVFLCTPQRTGAKTRWLAHSFHLLGRGSATHVRADPMRLAAANHLLEHVHAQSPSAGYKLLKVHTHCRGTGEEWFDRFSSGDRNSVMAQLKRDPDYALVMISPIRSIAIGYPDNRYFVSEAPSTQTSLRNTRNLETLYATVASRHGLELPRETATVKRRR
ncbi:MAG: hypothetical protein V1722_00620 [Candidatus Micrarchaeota archaeon]